MRVHQIWFGGQLPAHLATYMGTWQTPDVDYTLWTEKNIPRLYNQQLWNAAQVFTTKNSIGQFRSDIARYELLYEYGGLYVDCDYEQLKPVKVLFGNEPVVVAAEDHRWINNAFIYVAEPHHPMFLEIIEGLPERCRLYRGKRANIICGPQYFTPIAKRYGATVLPPEILSPYHWSVPDDYRPPPPESAYAVHHWENQRKARLRNARSNY